MTSYDAFFATIYNDDTKHAVSPRQLLTFIDDELQRLADLNLHENMNTTHLAIRDAWSNYQTKRREQEIPQPPKPSRIRKTMTLTNALDVKIRIPLDKLDTTPDYFGDRSMKFVGFTADGDQVTVFRKVSEAEYNRFLNIRDYYIDDAYFLPNSEHWEKHRVLRQALNAYKRTKGEPWRDSLLDVLVWAKQ
jgi:hypothetical protein